MNTTILRKIMMLVVILAGYVSIMGACCAECCGVPNSPQKTCNNDSGFCRDGDCIPGDPKPISNKCMGLDEGDPCEVSDEVTGTCVVLNNALSCLVIYQMTAP